jgi:flavin-dependent dehydrogenase
MIESHCDVVVVGAGPAGAVHAARLSAAGQRVVVVAPRSTHRAGTFELLSAAAEDDLRRLGMLDVIRCSAPRCAGTVFRWVTGQFRERSGPGWHGGWVVDRARLDRQLATLAAESGAHRIDGTAASLHTAAVGVQVRCRPTGQAESEVVVHAGRAVLASGRAGRLAARAGLRRQVIHSMVAITTTEPGPFPRIGPRLLVDAAARGWWYAMGDGTCATIGYVTDVDLLHHGPDRLAATWREAARGVEWLPNWARTAPVQGRPSTVQVTEVPTAADIVPIGDAAFSADPLSGHGITLAIAGGLRAAAEPGLYPQWVRQQCREHLEHEVGLYAAAGRHGESEFWRRRVQPSADATFNSARL